MKKVTHFRSPIDEAVINSGLRATSITHEMGITYNRMVALRRAQKVLPEDLRLCKAAIATLKAGPPKSPKKIKEENTTKKILAALERIEAKLG